MLSLTTLTAAFSISIMIIGLPFVNDVQYRAEFIQFSSLACSNDVRRNCFCSLRGLPRAGGLDGPAHSYTAITDTIKVFDSA